MKKDWDAVIEDSRELYQQVSAIREKILDRHPQAEMIRRFRENHRDATIRTQRNERYKAKELTEVEALLDDIDGKSLDDQQRDAVVTDEYNNLVIAGAGSGKTLTVVGKIKYLVERKNVRPEEILVTSFTRKSVNELVERIEKAGIEGVACRTFHKIGLDMLGKVGVANENELKKCTKAYLQKGILAHPDQMSAYLEFYGCYKHIPKDASEYENDGERCEALKAMDLRTLKGQLELSEGKLDTFQGERVKSQEELMIANFLFLHGVDYEYERNYDGDYETEGRAYQPDFYLPEYDIWLEHFGIDERGRCPQWALIEEKKYLEGVRWKRGIHATNGTRLLESYSYWNKDHDLLNRLQALLEDNGITLAMDEERLSDLYGRINADDRYMKSIVSLVTTFLSLAKANNIPMADVADKGREAYAGNGYMWHRFELFMTFVEPIMELYTAKLRDANQVDFDDMINMAAEKIAAEGTDVPYRYIIVDEYQDISKSRFGLIKTMREQCDAKLVCVGDDWQSIYRFAGSDVSLFTDFESYVGYHETLKIERTYRNSQELVDIASTFIEKNPSQIHKEMRSGMREGRPIVISMEDDMKEGFERCLRHIANEDGAKSSILVLGRHNFDIESLYPDFKDRDSFREGDVTLKRDRSTGDVHIDFGERDNITFMSVHRAKGLEADNVVVLNLINGMYGFPNRVEDDPILQVLLGKADEFEFAEERRLFYVAITRTRNKTYLVSTSQQGGADPSPFVNELRAMPRANIGIFRIKGQDAWHPVLCPKCGTGRLVVRQNSRTGKLFLGCTNYPYCERSYDQTEILEDRLRCPACDGWMVRRARESDGKPFFGCSNFPTCTQSYDATDDYKPIKHRTKSWAAVRMYDDHDRPGVHDSNENRSHKKGGRICPECGGDLEIRRNSQDGSKFYGCSNYPTCTYTRNVGRGGKSYAYSRISDKRCPECGGALKLLRNSKDGSRFYGCSNYPNCRYTKNA